MEQVTRTNLPIVGRIQHGEQQLVNHKKRVAELGYFIAKTKNSNMDFLLNRFEEKYHKKSYLTIQFFDENPLTIRKIRYNQGGAVCYCMAGTSKGKQKISNKWQDIECRSDCKYCIKQEGASKAICNYEGTLKFMIPEISQDRIWIMKITGQQSISNLEAYINFQKYLGNSIKGNYTIFLNQIEQTNSEGKKFNNYVIDIVKAENFNSNNNLISKNNTDKESTQEANKQNNSNSIKMQEKSEDNSKQLINSKEQLDNKSSLDNNIDDNASINGMETTTQQKQPKNTENKIKNYKEHCFLFDTEYKNFKKDGKDVEYLIAKVTNIDDKIIDVVVKPEFREELEKCDVGTELIIDLEEFNENIVSKNIEFVQKIPKKVAA